MYQSCSQSGRHTGSGSGSGSGAGGESSSSGGSALVWPASQSSYQSSLSSLLSSSYWSWLAWAEPDRVPIATIVVTSAIIVKTNIMRLNALPPSVPPITGASTLTTELYELLARQG